MTSVEPLDHFLFAYFTSQSEVDGEQVRFARSMGRNPLLWEELNSGHPVVYSTVGTGGVRDPFLLRAAGFREEEAAFYLIATDLRIHGRKVETAWAQAQHHGSRSIVVWESPDLVTWSEGRLAEIAPPEAGNAWAPEAIFDEERQEYFLFWASTLHPLGSDRDEAEQYNRMMWATTADFRSFSEPSVWIDHGWSVIDATVLRYREWFYRFVKDERNADSSGWGSKHITVERAQDLHAIDWELVAEGLGSTFDDGSSVHAGVEHGEGPIVVHTDDPDEFYLFIDEFGLRRYVPFHSTSINAQRWTMVADAHLPTGASHGSIVPITESEWKRLA